MKQLQRRKYNHNNTHCLQSLWLPLESQHSSNRQIIPVFTPLRNQREIRGFYQEFALQKVAAVQSSAALSRGSSPATPAETKYQIKPRISCFSKRLISSVASPLRRLRWTANPWVWHGIRRAALLQSCWRNICVGAGDLAVSVPRRNTPWKLALGSTLLPALCTPLLPHPGFATLPPPRLRSPSPASLSTIFAKFDKRRFATDRHLFSRALNRCTSENYCPLH